MTRQDRRRTCRTVTVDGTRITIRNDDGRPITTADLAVLAEFARTLAGKGQPKTTPEGGGQ